jgi:hypothetical protein
MRSFRIPGTLPKTQAQSVYLLTCQEVSCFEQLVSHAALQELKRFSSPAFLHCLDGEGRTPSPFLWNHVARSWKA